MPEEVAGVTGVLPQLPSAWLRNGGNLCSSWLPPPPQREWKERREGASNDHSGMDSEGGDVIERVVQLLADGLVLHLLCIDLIWGVQRGGEEEKEEGRREHSKSEAKRS